jgi:type IV secretion system protein TrbL
MDNFDLLTFIVNFFHDMFYSGLTSIQGYVQNVLLGLIVIDGVFFFVGTFWGDGLVAGWFPRLLKYGFYVAIVSEFPQMIEQILVGFFEVGAFLGGGGVTEEFLANPSALMGKGWEICKATYDQMTGEGESSGFFATLQNIVTGVSFIAALQSLLLALALLGIMLCFAIMALQISLTLIEFYIVMLIVYLLIPFGVVRPLAFMAEKAFGAIITFGVRVCALTIVVGVLERLLAQMPTEAMMLRRALFLLFIALFMAFITWMVPGMATAACGGSPSLGASGAAGAVMGGAGMVMSGAGAAAGIGRMAAGAGRSIGRTLAKKQSPPPPPTP